MATNGKATRDSIRTAIFSDVKSKYRTKRVDFFGQEIEIRQPPLMEILSLRDESVTEQDRVVFMLIHYCTVPDTEEPIFETADRDSLLSLPFGADFVRLSTAISELTDVAMAVEEAEGNSDVTL